MAENMPEWKLAGGRLHLAFDSDPLCGGTDGKPNNLPCESCLQLLLELLDTAFTPAPNLAAVNPWQIG